MDDEEDLRCSLMRAHLDKLCDCKEFTTVVDPGGSEVGQKNNLDLTGFSVGHFCQ